jgi:ParB/RepB/Spo0J family partition protein
MFQELDIDKVIPTKDNPRDPFKGTDPKIEKMAKSMKEHGVLEPVLCRPHPTKKGYFDLRAGACRLLAATMAGLTKIPAIVKDLTDEAAKDITIIENLQRNSLTPLEEARGIAMLFDSGRNAEMIAASVGSSVTWVIRRAKLASLGKAWLALYKKHPDMTASHLELVSMFPEEIQERMAKEISQQSWRLDPGRFGQFKEWVSEQLLHLRSAPFSLDDATLNPTAGACNACGKRSSCQPGLFDDDLNPEKIKLKDRCLDAECFHSKLHEFSKRREQELRAEHKNLIMVATEHVPYPETQSEEFRGILQYWQYEKAQKGGKGVVPAMIKYGPGTGKVIWVKPHNSGREDKSSTKKKDSSPAVKMQEKRKMLECRRVAFIITELGKFLEASGWGEVPGPAFARSESMTDAQKLEKLFCLVLAFGTEFNRRTGSDDAWTLFDTAEAQVKQDFPLAGNNAWDQIKAVIAGTLFFHNVSDIDKEAIQNAKNIADLLGMPWADLEAAAVKAIPQPKSWAKQEADIQAAAAEKKPAKTKGKKATKKKAKAAAFDEPEK